MALRPLPMKLEDIQQAIAGRVQQNPMDTAPQGMTCPMCAGVGKVVPAPEAQPEPEPVEPVEPAPDRE